MTASPPMPADGPSAPAPPTPPARVASRLTRAVAVLAVDVLGCCVHAMLFTLALAGRLVVLGPDHVAGVRAALITSATVVVGLSVLWPGLPWWGVAVASASQNAGRRPLVWDVTLRLGQLLQEDRRTRADAFRAALAVHGLLAAPTLGVVLALELGGLMWGALALLLLLSPGLSLWVGRLVLRRYPREALQSAEQAEGQPRRGVRRVLAGLALTTLALALGAALLVGVPAPTRLAGTCGSDAWGNAASIPGPLPGTALFMEASASHVTLSASDGGGPGAIPLATCSALTCGVRPARAMVEDRSGAQVVTLCPAAGAAETPAQQLELAPLGYRLDDGVARRVLRSRLSVGLALALLVLGFAFSRWGFRALLRWARHDGAPDAPSPHGRAAVLWALALGGTQVAWLLVTWLGP